MRAATVLEFKLGNAEIMATIFWMVGRLRFR